MKDYNLSRLITWQIKIRRDFLLLIDGEHSLEVKKIMSRRRDRELVNERQRIAKHLRSQGYSYPQIGWVMNRHHTSIIHLVNRKKENNHAS